MHESLYLDHGEPTIKALNGDSHLLEEFDLIWLLGFGERSSFLDRMQLWRNFDQSRFVNKIDAMVYYHAKAGLLTHQLLAYQPETCVSRDAEYLFNYLENSGEMIVKPNAGSFGEKVFSIKAKDENARAILETVTEHGYALLQKRVNTETEKRVLIVDGEVLGCYGKEGDILRKNKAKGIKPIPSELTDFEKRLTQDLGEQCRILGIRFATLDIAYPYLLDVNFVNPGYLQTHEELTGEDLSKTVCSRILLSLSDDE